MSEHILDIQNLNLGFQIEEEFYQALFDVNFSLKKGETLAIVGESGCGKTMSALSILNLIPKNARIMSGNIIYNNENLLTKTQKELNKIRGGKIALIPQDPMTSLNPLFTIGDQLLEVINLHQNLKGDLAYQKAIEALEAVQIPNAKSRMNSYPHEFSGGMKQRAIIAMALSCNADILIADEPTTALDVTIQAQIMNLLQDIKKENNTAILLITHDLALVNENADEVAVMYSGRIIEYADCYNFFKNPKHPYSNALLKSLPSTNLKILESIEGQPPKLTEKVTGCRFNPRCKKTIDICKLEVPKPQKLSSTHSCACFNMNN